MQRFSRLASCTRSSLSRNLHTSYPRHKNVIPELRDRGFVAALTSPQLNTHLQTPSCIYAGIDPSASSLHVGNLLPLLGLLHFHNSGHQVLALIGGATGSIGDPSGKSAERPLLPAEQLSENIKGITGQVHRFFENGSAYAERKFRSVKDATVEKDEVRGKGSVKVLNNLDWFGGMGFLEFLRDYGKLVRVGNMLSRDAVKSRLESDTGISYTEFTYQLLQAYDFLHLHRTHSCRVQLGGSDQWGNIISGIDLVHRIRASEREGEKQTIKDQEETVFGLTMPLLLADNGEKFGKSAGNAVWLDEGRTSTFEFYQFFLRTHDTSVEQYLKLFTLLPLEEIHQVMRDHNEARSKQKAQKVLAAEVTDLVHGPEAVRKALSATEILYHTDPSLLTASTVLDALAGDPRLRRTTWNDIKGIPITKLAVTFGLCKSRSDANRSMAAKQFLVNNQILDDTRREINREDVVDGSIVKFRSAKRDQVILYITD